MNVSVVNARWQCSMSLAMLNVSTTSPNINSVSHLTTPHGPWHKIPRRNSSASGLQSADFLLKHPQRVLPQHIHSTTLKSIAEQPAHWILNRQHTPLPVQLFCLWCLAMSPISSPIHILSPTHRTFASSSPKCSCVAELLLTARHCGSNRVTNRTLSCLSCICQELLISKCLDIFIIYLVILTILALQNVYHST